MKNAERYRDLKERTEEYALRMIRMCSALPEKNPVAQTLGRQVLRSGTSVGANYREACRSRSKLEFISKMGDCLKELDESDYWLKLLVKSGTIGQDRMRELVRETDELTAIFVTSIKHAKENKE